jgi:hypothetical protein
VCRHDPGIGALAIAVTAAQDRHHEEHRFHVLLQSLGETDISAGMFRITPARP